MSVVLYHQDGCPMCKAVELQLKKAGVEYESNKNLDDMMAKGIMHTPVLDVDGQLLAGKSIIDWIKGR